MLAALVHTPSPRPRCSPPRHPTPSVALRWVIAFLHHPCPTPAAHVDQGLAGLVAEGLVLVQLATGQVVQAGQLQRLVKLLGGLAAFVQLLQVALLCCRGGNPQAHGGGSRRGSDGEQKDEQTNSAKGKGKEGGSRGGGREGRGNGRGRGVSAQGQGHSRDGRRAEQGLGHLHSFGRGQRQAGPWDPITQGLTHGALLLYPVDQEAQRLLSID